MSISIYSINQNLADLNSYKEELPKEIKDAIERVTDDSIEILDKLDSFLADIKR
jgi:hypothetical protein